MTSAVFKLVRGTKNKASRSQTNLGFQTLLVGLVCTLECWLVGNVISSSSFLAPATKIWEVFFFFQVISTSGLLRDGHFFLPANHFFSKGYPLHYRFASFELRCSRVEVSF